MACRLPSSRTVVAEHCAKTHSVRSGRQIAPKRRNQFLLRGTGLRGELGVGPDRKCQSECKEFEHTWSPHVAKYGAEASWVPLWVLELHRRRSFHPQARFGRTVKPETR